MVIGFLGWPIACSMELMRDFSRSLSLHNARTVCTQTAVVGVAALGMTVIIIAGGIDLSIGTAIALCDRSGLDADTWLPRQRQSRAVD